MQRNDQSDDYGYQEDDFDESPMNTPSGSKGGLADDKTESDDTLISDEEDKMQEESDFTEE